MMVQDPMTSLLRLVDQTCTNERPEESTINAPTIIWGDSEVIQQLLTTDRMPKKHRNGFNQKKEKPKSVQQTVHL